MGIGGDMLAFDGVNQAGPMILQEGKDGLSGRG
jgi:hypothetical protein